MRKGPSAPWRVRDTLKAAIVGVSGPALTGDERLLLREHDPAGVVLFGRNVVDPAQLARLTDHLRDVLAADAVLMVDQEGGRVQRMRPPQWSGHPSAAAIGAAGERAAWLHGALIGAEARAAGFDVVCAPVLDLRRPEGHDAIGDRTFGSDPAVVAALGGAMADGLLAAGIQPVAKHAPGHGRAVVDSHVSLPEVDGLDDNDLAAFADVARLPWLMTAHVVYRAVDTAPATLSAVIIEAVIRRRLGFDGVLVSDDLAMGALSGFPEERARRCLAAGCDIALYCPGDPAANRAVLAACPELTDMASARLARARGMAARAQKPLDVPAMRAERQSLLT